MKRRVIFHPLLFAVAPVLSLYIVNAEQIYWQEIAGTLLIVLLLTGGLWVVSRRLFKNPDKSAWFTSFFLIAFFSYNRIWPATDAGLPIKFLLWLGALLAVGLWTARTWRDFKLLTSFLNVVALGWLLVILAPWAYYNLVLTRDSNVRVNQYVADWQSQARAETPVCAASSLPAKPDIYYIILDGYGRADILQQLYGFDNTAFLTFLQDNGFYIAERSTSNYAQTALSLSSSLSFQYLDELITRLGSEVRTIMPLREMITHNRLSNYLQPLGYQRVVFSSGYPPTEMPDADRYRAPARRLSAFQQELINSTPLPLLLAAVPGFSQYDIHRERVLFALEQLPAVTENPEPTLTFVHLLAPHPPFVFRSNGEAVQASLVTIILVV